MFRSQFTRALTLATIVSLLMSSVALADTVSNTLDNTVDNAAEVMALTAGGAKGSTFLYVSNTNTGDDTYPDSTNNCNLSGSGSLTISIASSDSSVASVALVSPTSDTTAKTTFNDCESRKNDGSFETGADIIKALVTPVGAGSATITVSQVSTTAPTGSDFYLAPATFTVNVSAAPVTDPCLSVTAPAAPAFYTDGEDSDGLMGWFVTVPTVSASSDTANATISYSIDGGETFSATAPTLGEGTTTVIARATSATCNKTSDTSTTFMVDTIAPAVNPADVNLTAWTNTPPVQQSFTSNDGTGSGLANAADDTSFTLSVSADSVKNADGTITPTSDSRTVADVAGNTTTRTLSARIDTVAPVISGSNVVNTTWRNTDLVASFTASDALSGLANSADASFNLTASANSTLDGDGNPVPTVVSKTVYDNAGNSSTRSVSALIDKLAPSVSVTGVSNGAQYILGSVPAAGCSTSDSLSGVATGATASTAGGPVGNVTVTCSGATDNAGNTASASVTFQVVYNWSGFFRPVDNKDANGMYILNTAKAGSSIPLKFSLGGNQGLNIMAAGFPKVTAITCSTGAVTDALEEYATVTANNGLNYDATADQYNYVWKTASTYAGKCFQLEMKLIDGTSHIAHFKFTK